MADHLVVTCEHGGNRVPPRYRALFAGFEPLLATHRGYDPGALALARQMAAAFAAPLFVSITSRLVIDLNRSLGHPKLYSGATRGAPPAVRREIRDRYYLPYRSAVESHIADAIARGDRVIHVSSHSFTPVLDGAVRNADIGLLYDPGRPKRPRCAGAGRRGSRRSRPNSGCAATIPTPASPTASPPGCAAAFLPMRISGSSSRSTSGTSCTADDAGARRAAG